VSLPHSAAVDPSETAPVFFLDEEDHPPNGTLLGFWIYLMSDCLVFAALFAVYGVLGASYAGGPTPATLFQLPTVALNTAMLLMSSLTFGFAALAGQRSSRGGVLAWLAVTALFGGAFLVLEGREFAEFVRIGAGPDRSAFLSSFFALVGTHGLHVAVGLVWIAVLVTQIVRYGLTEALERRLACLGLFWHFLDVIWIGVFSFVYLIGTLR
jgi:cytochrome o ubiquinol oxidase subunit 3